MHTQNGLILVITPSLTLLVLAAILMIAWLMLRSQRFLLWQACAYSLTALSLSAQTLLSMEVLTRYALLIGTIYLLSAWCLVSGELLGRKVGGISAVSYCTADSHRHFGRFVLL